MLRKRIIPILLLREKSLVKTIKFKKFQYIGDPLNTIRMFNEFEVDELIINDILASKQNTEPNYDLLKDLSSECFMPLTYGGGIKSLGTAKKLFDLGFEKIILNSELQNNFKLLNDLSNYFGSQAITVSIDVDYSFLNIPYVAFKGGINKSKISPLKWSKMCSLNGAGEIMITSIKNEGTWKGYDIELIKQISKEVNTPVIANGGAGSINDLKNILNFTDVTAAAASSLFLFQKKGMGVLVNFPNVDVPKIQL